MIIKKVCVFCASSPKISDNYKRDAALLGKIFADQKIEVNYGGGAVGLMGEIADSMLDNGGIITGIIPLFMKERDWAHKKISNMLVVSDMHERKRLMIKNTDAVIALPGGIGTLEELAEVITLKQLGQYLKPVIILNTGGYYNEFIFFLSRMIEEGFMHHMHKKLWSEVNSPFEILSAIKDSPAWDADSISYTDFEE